MTEQLQAQAPSPQGIVRFHTVCNRVIWADPAYFPKAEYRGRTIYFCTDSCLGAFLADPDVFFRVHSQPKWVKGHVEASEIDRL